MKLPFSLSQLYNSYEKWVSTHPHLVSDAESIAKWISYYIAVRINDSNVVTELIYSLSNLLVLFNDRIIHKSLETENKSDEVTKLKLLLTTLEYCEVFIELSVKQYLGNKAKWIVIVLLQVYKCFGKLILLYYYKEEIVQSPPIPQLQRNKEVERKVTDNFPEEPSTFTLKRSGRVVRKVDASPPKHLRAWDPPTAYDHNKPSSCKDAKLTAETFYAFKPLLHLTAMRCFGGSSWKTWLVALGFDIVSLRMYSTITKKSQYTLSNQQRMEISRRCVMMVMYLMRSPFYEKYSKNKITSVLEAVGKMIPLANSISQPLLQYLPHWQSTYFYMWSS